MINQDSELDAFKREIDLRQFAESLGYQIDRRESWRGSAVLRRAADKIVVKRNGNGHYVFFSLRDDDDNGTVIDFVQRRQHLSLGAVRQVLRPWIGRPASAPQFPELPPASPNRMRIEREYRSMAEAQRYPYLERDRGVSAALLSRHDFEVASGSTIAATPCFRISTPRGCAATRSRIADSRASPQVAKRASGSRILGRTTGVWC